MGWVRVGYGVMVAAVIAACGRAPTADEKQVFSPYRERFAAYARAYGRGAGTRRAVDIVFGSVGRGELAVCEERFLRTPRIVVNRDVWQKQTDTDHEILILHELGHCALGRNHNDDLINAPTADGRLTARIPASLMHSRALRAALYRAHKEHYVKELFSAR